MEFDSLAFSAARSRSVPVQENRMYCPACQEQCVPDKYSSEPICPTCGGGTTFRSPLQPSGEDSIEELVDEDISTDISGEGVAHTRPRSAVETETPSGNLQGSPDDDDDSAQLREPAPPPTQEEGGRTVVGERVAREVLAFMEAIERGDLSLAGWLPAPPGVTILEDLPGLGARRSTFAPALERVVKNLPRVQVEENSWVLHQTVLRVKGKTELDVDAVFAPFSPPPSKPIIDGPIVLAVPLTAHENFQNEGDIKGSVLVVDRGVCTFASKALRADAAGAAAAVIVQTHDVWPYVMEDSKGEVKAAGGLNIPVCMVSREKGEAIKKALKEAAEGQTVRAELSMSSSEKDCIVCQELYTVGSTLVRLPCGHLYHEGCLLKWLKMRNTCPYCRQELPSSNEEVERERTRREGQEGSEAWRGFFN